MENPYESPQFSAEVPEDDLPRLKALMARREFIGREESLLTMGLLFRIVGVAVAILPLIWMAEGMPVLPPSGDWDLSHLHPQMFSMVTHLAAPLVAGAILLAAGWNLRKFTMAGRTLGTMVAVMSFILYPIGFLIGGYFLFMLYGAKGRMVFSREYQTVIASTPDLKASPSRWPWLLALYLLIAIGRSLFD